MSTDDDDFDLKSTPPRAITGHTPKSYRMSDEERDRRKAHVRGIPAMTEEITDRLEILLTGQPDTHGHLAELRRRDVHELIWNLADSLAEYRAAVRKEQSSGEEVREQVATAVADNDRRLKVIEGTIGTVKGHSWKVALAIVGTLAGSATAIIATLQSKAEAAGAAAQRDADQQRRIDRLERLLDDRPRPRDYDYDLLPRRATSATPRKDPEP